MSFYFRLLGPILRFYRKDHDVLNLTKARCSRHTFYTLAVIHEHIFDMEIVLLSGCHQRIGLFPKRNYISGKPAVRSIVHLTVNWW